MSKKTTHTTKFDKISGFSFEVGGWTFPPVVYHVQGRDQEITKKRGGLVTLCQHWVLTRFVKDCNIPRQRKICIIRKFNESLAVKCPHLIFSRFLYTTQIKMELNASSDFNSYMNTNKIPGAFWGEI